MQAASWWKSHLREASCRSSCRRLPLRRRRRLWPEIADCACPSQVSFALQDQRRPAGGVPAGAAQQRETAHRAPHTKCLDHAGPDRRLDRTGTRTMPIMSRVPLSAWCKGHCPPRRVGNSAPSEDALSRIPLGPIPLNDYLSGSRRPHMQHYSYLDLAPIPEGQTAAQALRSTVDLAQAAEKAGFHRYWLAEHHNMPGIRLCRDRRRRRPCRRHTKTMRIGAGGIMLPNHFPPGHSRAIRHPCDPLPEPHRPRLAAPRHRHADRPRSAPPHGAGRHLSPGRPGTPPLPRRLPPARFRPSPAPAPTSPSGSSAPAPSARSWPPTLASPTPSPPISRRPT